MKRLHAFAVDTDAVQLVWASSAEGKVVVAVDGQELVVDAAGGPGSVTVAGLAPSRSFVATVTEPDGRARSVPFRTLDEPPGPVRCRIATMSDLHLGQHSFGYRDTIVEPKAVGERVSARCVRMALAEAVAWGADLIVIKGDVTNTGRRYEWAQAAELFADVAVPMVILPGNHESAHFRTIESWKAAEHFGLHVVRSVESIDLPAIRVVLATTAIPGRSRGRLEHRREAVVAAAADAPAALVTLHHQLELYPDLPLWPPGIPRAQADRFLDDLAAAQPASLVTSGHTHRLRRRQHGPVTITQVGSTKDYPGVWAGYAAYDTGITQVVHRIADPECLRWTDATRRAVGGLWPHISAGSLDTRCFTLPWSTARGH